MHQKSSLLAKSVCSGYSKCTSCCRKTCYTSCSECLILLAYSSRALYLHWVINKIWFHHSAYCHLHSSTYVGSTWTHQMSKSTCIPKQCNIPTHVVQKATISYVVGNDVALVYRFGPCMRLGGWQIPISSSAGGLLDQLAMIAWGVATASETWIYQMFSTWSMKLYLQRQLLYIDSVTKGIAATC